MQCERHIYKARGTLDGKGVAATEHLFNKSAIAFRFKTEADPWGVFTIAEDSDQLPRHVDAGYSLLRHLQP